MAGGGGGETDLNLVPYLDIMVNLIMFMLVITANIVELRESPVLAPRYVPGGGSQPDPNAPPNMTVLVSSKGFGVFGSGGTEVPATDIPMVGGAYDYQKLSTELRKYRKTYKPSDNLTIVPESSISYRVVVETMDAAREDSRGPLFPGVTLAAAVGFK